MGTAQADRAAQIEELRILRELKDREYAQDCKLWAHEQVMTLDEATKRVRRWPDDKPYLDELLDLYADPNEQLIAIPKSRRLMVTYSLALKVTHEARYHPYNAIYIQSDTEEKSAFFVDQRCCFIENNLSDIRCNDDDEDKGWCRRSYKPIRTKDGMVGRMTYNGTGSYIRGMAQGADKVRSYTPSWLIMDESEFQDEAHAAVTAGIALAEDSKDMKFILISTSNGPQGVIAGICKEAGFVKWS